MEPKSDLISLVLLSALLLGGNILLFLTRSPSSASLRAKRTQVTRFGALAILLQCCADTTSAQEGMPLSRFAAHGFVEQHVFDPHGRAVSTNTFIFDFYQGEGSTWRITVASFIPQWQLTSTEHIAYNGTDVFSIVHSDKRVDVNMKPIPNTPLETGFSPARICRGPYPVDHSSVVGLLWLAFVAGPYLSEKSNARVPNLLVTDARTDPLAWTCDFDYSLDRAGDPPLLQSGTFRINKTLISLDLVPYQDLDEPQDGIRVQKVQRQLEAALSLKTNALAAAAFNLEEIGESFGRRFPKKFTGIRHCCPDSIAGVYAMVRWHGETTNTLMSQPMAILPLLVGRVSIDDRRFMFRGRDRYFGVRSYDLGTNHWPISTNDPLLAWGKDEALFAPRVSASRRTAAYYFFVAAFVLTLVAPGIFLVLKHRARATINP
jgi:hypothetical protein